MERGEEGDHTRVVRRGEPQLAQRHDVPLRVPLPARRGASSALPNTGLRPTIALAYFRLKQGVLRRVEQVTMTQWSTRDCAVDS